MISKILCKIKDSFKRSHHKRILDFFPSGNKPKGHVLVSYLPEPMTYGKNDERLLHHSNAWESAEIAGIFNKHGYSVDAIYWNDTTFVPQKEYVAVFDIHMNLKRYSTDATYKVLHVTGSDPSFSNMAEQQRISDLEMRRGVTISPRRSIKTADVVLFHSNLAAADAVTLIGNEVTSSTFPSSAQHKMNLVCPTGAHLASIRDSRTIQIRKEFVWFNGTGAVHKGLDLVLEVFARNPGLVLHVVGPYLNEREFVSAYEYELTRCPNIISHGFLSPSSSKFQDITKHVIGFVNPSCSEGVSTAAITCMQYGMVPLLSENTGINLNEGWVTC